MRRGTSPTRTCDGVQAPGGVGELGAERSGASPLRVHGKYRYGESGRIGDKQVDMAGLTVELGECGTKPSTSAGEHLFECYIVVARCEHD